MDDNILVYMVLIGVTVIVAGIKLKTGKRQGRLLENLALAGAKTGKDKLGNSYARGFLDGFPVKVELKKIVSSLTESAAVVFSLDLQTRGLPGFTISRQKERVVSVGNNWKQAALPGREFFFGDPEFDNTVRLHPGMPVDIIARLNIQARALIWGLVNDIGYRDFQLTGEHILVVQELDKFSDSEDINAVLSQLSELAAILCRSGETIDLLRENYFEENNIVRKSLFTMLAENDYEIAEDDPILKDALNSDDLELRFDAVMLTGKAGWNKLPYILKHAERGTILKTLEYMVDLTVPGLQEEVGRIKADISDEELQIRILDYLEKLYNHRAEKIICGRLLAGNRDLPYNCRNKCIEILSEKGSYDSIAVLNDTRTYLTREQVDAAITRIQERIGSGDEGWLSMETRDNSEGLLSRPRKKEGNKSDE